MMGPIGGLGGIRFAVGKEITFYRFKIFLVEDVLYRFTYGKRKRNL